MATKNDVIENGYLEATEDGGYAISNPKDKEVGKNNFSSIQNISASFSRKSSFMSDLSDSTKIILNEEVVVGDKIHIVDNSRSSSEIIVDNVTEISTLDSTDPLGDGSLIGKWRQNGDGTSITGLENMTEDAGVIDYTNGGKFGGIGRYYSPGQAKTLGTINNADAKAISVNFRIDATPTGARIFFSLGKQTNGKARLNLAVTSDLKLAVSYVSPFTKMPIQNYNVFFTLGEWHNLFINGTSVYFNKKYIFTGEARDMTSDTFGVYLGGNGAYDYGYYYSNGAPFIGALDQVEIYDKLFSDKELEIMLTQKMFQINLANTAEDAVIIKNPGISFNQTSPLLQSIGTLSGGKSNLYESLDILGDGSCVALYKLNGDANDSGPNAWNGNIGNLNSVPAGYMDCFVFGEGSKLGYHHKTENYIDINALAAGFFQTEKDFAISFTSTVKNTGGTINAIFGIYPPTWTPPYEYLSIRNSYGQIQVGRHYLGFNNASPTYGIYTSKDFLYDTEYYSFVISFNSAAKTITIFVDDEEEASGVDASWTNFNASVGRFRFSDGSGGDGNSNENDIEQLRIFNRQLYLADAIAINNAKNQRMKAEVALEDIFGINDPSIETRIDFSKKKDRLLEISSDLHRFV